MKNIQRATRVKLPDCCRLAPPGCAHNMKCAILNLSTTLSDPGTLCVILTQSLTKKPSMMMTFDLNPEPDSPRSARLDAQHVPGVLAVADASDGVGLLFGEAHADLGHRALPSILAHVSDG